MASMLEPALESFSTDLTKSDLLRLLVLISNVVKSDKFPLTADIGESFIEEPSTIIY